MPLSYLVSITSYFMSVSYVSNHQTIRVYDCYPLEASGLSGKLEARTGLFVNVGGLNASSCP